ncbi:MAG: hypothetical protein K2K00_02485 [Muribaculaceae bacterium]|nr:hypothetical protein [Muribaculaceae bacterium]MDE6702527.1 hypothetical protein [Muribaculaceae bacterium]
MKKISTPLISESEEPMMSDKSFGPRKSTLEFIRNFARACQTLPLRNDEGELSAFVLN